MPRERIAKHLSERAPTVAGSTLTSNVTLFVKWFQENVLTYPKLFSGCVLFQENVLCGTKSSPQDKNSDRSGALPNAFTTKKPHKDYRKISAVATRLQEIMTIFAKMI